jgi:6,7-dimethyl-8-ribityllumazine synthase
LRAAAEASDPYEAVVALGCVIRGETGHYDIVAGESARALMDISVAYEMPLGNGILTVETEAQALARARVAEMNKGGGAAEAALAVLALKRKLDSTVGA